MKPSEKRTDYTTLTHNLAWLRKKYGYSKKTMAKHLGIGVGSLNKLERGEMPRRLSVEIFYAVYDHFGIRPSVLLTHWLE